MGEDINNPWRSLNSRMTLTWPIRIRNFLFGAGGGSGWDSPYTYGLINTLKEKNPAQIFFGSLKTFFFWGGGRGEVVTKMANVIRNRFVNSKMLPLISRTFWKMFALTIDRFHQKKKMLIFRDVATNRKKKKLFRLFLHLSFVSFWLK